MAHLWHLIHFDLRRLWPLVVLQGLVLAAGLFFLGTSGERPGHPLPWTLGQELLVPLILGLLIVADSPGSRRPLAATRPVSWTTYFASKLAFALALVWLPRAGGQILRFLQMGIDGDTLLLASFDVLASQLLWVLVLMILAAHCRSFAAYVVVASVGMYFLLEIDRSLRDWILFRSGLDAAELSFAQGLYALLLAGALALALGDLFRFRDRTRMLFFVPVLAAAALVPQPLAGLLFGFWGSSGLEPGPGPEAPADVSFHIVPGSASTGSCNRQSLLYFRLEPEGLDPELGVEVVSVEGEWSAADGDSVPVAQGCRMSTCLDSRWISETHGAKVDWPPQDLTGCGQELRVALFERPAGENPMSRDEAGTLRLRIRARVFREQVQQEPVREGASLRGRSETKVLQFVVPDGGEVSAELRFLKFSLPRSYKYYEQMMQQQVFHQQEPDFRLVHRDTRLQVQQRGRSGGSAEERFLLPYRRLQIESDDLRFRSRDLAEAGGDSLSEFELFWVRRQKSEVFEVEVEVADFRLMDYLRHGR